MDTNIKILETLRHFKVEPKVKAVPWIWKVDGTEAILLQFPKTSLSILKGGDLSFKTKYRSEQPSVAWFDLFV